MMKTNYIRDFKHNYLVIRDDRVIEGNYEIKMMTENRIEGLLRCEERMVNGEGFLYFDITSKHMFKNVFSEETLGFEIIKGLFTNIAGLCKEMEKYLLYDDGLVLDPEYIYYDIESRKYYFLYYTDESRTGIQELFEFLTSHVDSEDFPAVEAVYQMYDMSKKSFYTFEDILRWFSEEYSEKDFSETEKEMTDTSENYACDSNSHQEAICDDAYDAWEKEVILNRQNRQKTKRGKSLIARIKSFFIKEPDKDTDRTDDEYCEEADYCYAQDTGEDNNTVFIPWVENSEHKLYGMGRGNKTHIDLSILPVTVGKMKGAADIVLNDESVSRLHAKLMRAGSRFFLLDLNSTNGSYKNGVRLSPNEKVPIEPGDEIGFGKLKFIYR